MFLPVSNVIESKTLSKPTQSLSPPSLLLLASKEAVQEPKEMENHGKTQTHEPDSWDIEAESQRLAYKKIRNPKTK